MNWFYYTRHLPILGGSYVFIGKKENYKPQLLVPGV